MHPRKAPKNALTAAAGADPSRGRDHLSNLPDGVLQHMLCFLPAQDAVRTCVLAKRWRHLWKSVTGLRFVCGGTREPESISEIQDFVDHLLRLRIREATPLHTCEFRMDEVDDDDMTGVHFWIRIALHCKVQVLRLFYWCTPCPDDHPIFISQYLKKLEIHEIAGDNITPRKFLDFSCCPVLVDLKVVDFNLFGASLISSQSLKCLTIERCVFYDDRRMSICVPNLVSLWLEVLDGRTPSLQRMPSLLAAVVKIDSYDDAAASFVPDPNDDDNQSILLQGLLEARNLVLISRSTDMFIFRRDLKFCSSFNNLKSLVLNENWCKPADFSSLACLLKLSPVLENLTLQLYSKGPNHQVKMKLCCKPLEKSTAISQHLKTVEVKCKVYDERVHNVLMFLSKLLWFQFS